MSLNIIEQKKCVRSAYFSDPEEELLVRLVLNRKDVIECKVTDTQRNDNKTRAWDDITIEFNANCLNKVRTAAVLKKKYENIKKYIRQAASKERMSRKLTGGGPGPSEWRPKSEVHAALRDVIATSVDGLRAICDDDDDYDVNTIVFPKMSAISDNVNQVTTDNEYEVEYLEETGVILSGNNNFLEQKVTGNESVYSTSRIPFVPLSVDESGVDAASSQSIDAAQKRKVEMWEQYNPAMSKRPKSSALKTHKKHQTSIIESDLKKKLLERDQEMMEEVHQLNVQKNKIELESAHISLQTKKMKLQSQQLRYQHMREEHAMRMKLLSTMCEKSTGR